MKRDFIDFQPKTRDVITSSQPYQGVQSNVCLALVNKFDISNGATHDMYNAVCAHQDEIWKFGKMIHRIYLIGVMYRKEDPFASGQVFPVAPNLWMALNRVVNLESVAKLTIRNTVEAYFGLATDSTSEQVFKTAIIDYNYLNKLIVNDCDPISGKKDDFGAPFDITLVTGPDFGRYCIPDSESKSHGEGCLVAAIHHPGVANTSAVHKALLATYGDLSIRPSFEDAFHIFYGFDRKCCSFGKLLAGQYPDPNVMAHTCCLFSGSSAAPLHRVGAPASTFCAVHIGGDVVHCVDCLKISPKTRRCKEHPEASTACRDCRATGCDSCKKDPRHLKEPFGYNYAYAVHHPAFVLLYAKYVLPAFGTAVPELVKQYLIKNKNVLEKHKDWIGPQVNFFLQDNAN